MLDVYLPHIESVWWNLWKANKKNWLVQPTSLRWSLHLNLFVLDVLEVLNPTFNQTVLKNKHIHSSESNHHLVEAYIQIQLIVLNYTNEAMNGGTRICEEPAKTTALISTDTNATSSPKFEAAGTWISETLEASNKLHTHAPRQLRCDLLKIYTVKEIYMWVSCSIIVCKGKTSTKWENSRLIPV